MPRELYKTALAVHLARAFSMASTGRSRQGMGERPQSVDNLMLSGPEDQPQLFDIWAQADQVLWVVPQNIQASKGGGWGCDFGSVNPYYGSRRTGQPMGNSLSPCVPKMPKHQLQNYEPSLWGHLVLPQLGDTKKTQSVQHVYMPHDKTYTLHKVPCSCFLKFSYLSG